MNDETRRRLRATGERWQDTGDRWRASGGQQMRSGFRFTFGFIGFVLAAILVAVLLGALAR